MSRTLVGKVLVAGGNGAEVVAELLMNIYATPVRFDLQAVADRVRRLSLRRHALHLMNALETCWRGGVDGRIEEARELARLLEAEI